MNRPPVVNDLAHCSQLESDEIEYRSLFVFEIRKQVQKLISELEKREYALCVRFGPHNLRRTFGHCSNPKNLCNKSAAHMEKCSSALRTGLKCQFKHVKKAIRNYGELEIYECCQNLNCQPPVNEIQPKETNSIGQSSQSNSNRNIEELADSNSEEEIEDLEPFEVIDYKPIEELTKLIQNIPVPKLADDKILSEPTIDNSEEVYENNSCSSEESFDVIPNECAMNDIYFENNPKQLPPIRPLSGSKKNTSKTFPTFLLPNLQKKAKQNSSLKEELIHQVSRLKSSTTKKPAVKDLTSLTPSMNGQTECLKLKVHQKDTVIVTQVNEKRCLEDEFVIKPYRPKNDEWGVQDVKHLEPSVLESDPANASTWKAECSQHCAQSSPVNTLISSFETYLKIDPNSFHSREIKCLNPDVEENVSMETESLKPNVLQEDPVNAYIAAFQNYLMKEDSATSTETEYLNPNVSQDAINAVFASFKAYLQEEPITATSKDSNGSKHNIQQEGPGNIQQEGPVNIHQEGPVNIHQEGPVNIHQEGPVKIHQKGPVNALMASFDAYFKNDSVNSISKELNDPKPSVQQDGPANALVASFQTYLQEDLGTWIRHPKQETKDKSYEQWVVGSSCSSIASNADSSNNNAIDAFQMQLLSFVM